MLKATRSTSNSLCRCVGQVDSTTQGYQVDRHAHHLPKHSQRKLIERITCSRGVATEAKHRLRRNHKLINWSANNQQTTKKQNGSQSEIVIETHSINSYIGDDLSDSSSSTITSDADKLIDTEPRLLSTLASVPLFVSSETKITDRAEHTSSNDKSIQFNIRKDNNNNKGKVWETSQSLSNNLVNAIRDTNLKLKNSRPQSRCGLLKQEETEINTRITETTDHKWRDEKKTDRMVRLSGGIRKRVKTSRVRLRKSDITMSQEAVTQRHRSSGTDDKLSGSIGDITTWATAVITDILYKPETRKSTTVIEKTHNKQLSSKLEIKTAQKNATSKRSRVPKKDSSGMIVRQRILSQCKSKRKFDDIKLRKPNQNEKSKREKPIQKPREISNLSTGPCKHSFDTTKIKDLSSETRLILESNNTKLIDGSNIVVSKDQNTEWNLTSPIKGGNKTLHNDLTSSTKCNASYTSIHRRKEIVYRPVAKKCFSALKSGSANEIKKHKDIFVKNNAGPLKNRHNIDGKGDVVKKSKNYELGPEKKRKEEKKKRKSRAHITSDINKTYTIQPKVADDRARHRAQKQAVELREDINVKAVNPYLSIKKIQGSDGNSQLQETLGIRKVTNPFKKIVDPDDPPNSTLKIGSSFSFEMELFKQTVSSSSSNDKLTGDRKADNRKKYKRRRIKKKSLSNTKPQGGQVGATVRDQIYCTLDLTLANNKWSPNKLYNSEPFENKELEKIKKSKKRLKRNRIEDDFIAREIDSSISCPVNDDKSNKQNSNQKSSNSKIPAKTNNIVAKLKKCFCAFKFPNKSKENNLLQPYLSPSGKEFQNGSSFSFNLELYKDTTSPEAIHTPIISGYPIKAPSEAALDVIYGNNECDENAKLKYTMKPPATDENMRRCYRWLNLHSRKFVNPSKTTICEKNLCNSRKVNSAITSEHTFIPCDVNKEKFKQFINETNRIKKYVHTLNSFEANSTNVQSKNKRKVNSNVTKNYYRGTESNDGDHLSQARPSLERIRVTSKQSKTRSNEKNVITNDVMQAQPSLFPGGSKFSFDVEICQGGTAQIRYSKPEKCQNNSKIKECNCDYPKECQPICEFYSSSQSTAVHDKDRWDPIRYSNFLKEVLKPTKKGNQPTRKLKNVDTKQKKTNQNMMNRNICNDTQYFHKHKLRKQSPKKYKCPCLVTPEESKLFKRLSQHLVRSDLNIMHNLERFYEGYPKPEYLINKGRNQRFNSNTSKIDQSYRKKIGSHQKESETNINVKNSVSSILRKCLSTLKFQKSNKDVIFTQGQSEDGSFDSSKRMQVLRTSGVNVEPRKCTYLEYPVLLDQKYTDISKSIRDEHQKRKQTGHGLNSFKLKDMRTQPSNNFMPTALHPIRSNFSLEVENCVKSRSPTKLAPLLPKFSKIKKYRGIYLSENTNKFDVPPVYRHTPAKHASKKYSDFTVDSTKHKKLGKLDRVSESNETLARCESNKKKSKRLIKKESRSKQISGTSFNFEYFFELSPTYNIPRRYDKAVARSSEGKRSSTIVNTTFANPTTQHPDKTKHFYGPDGKLLLGKSSVIVAAMWKVILDDEVRIQRTKLHKKGVPCKCKKGAPCQIVNKTTCRDKGSQKGTGKGGGDKADKCKYGKKCASGGKKTGNGDDKGSKDMKKGTGGICGKHAISEKSGKGKCQGKGKCPSAIEKQEETDEKISRDDFSDVPDWAFSILEFLKLLPDKKKRVTPKAYKVKCPGKKKCMKKKCDEEEDEEEEEDDEKMRKKILDTLYITKGKMKFKFDSDICHKVQGKKKPPFFNSPGKVQKSVCEWPGCKEEIEQLKRPCTVCGFNDEAALHIKVDKHGMGIVNKEDLRKKIVEREITAGRKKVKCSEFLKDTRPGDRPSCLCCPTPVCTKHDADKNKKPPCGMQLTLDPKYSLKMPCSPFRPCVCGSGVCKKEHATMIHAMARPKFIPCVCGSPVCEEERKHVAERKHAKEAMKLKRKLMKMKAEHRDFALKNLDMFYLNSYLRGDLEWKLFQDTMRGLPLSAEEKDTLIKRDKERELRKDRNCQYRMRRYAEIEEEIARLRRKDDKKATFLMGDPDKLGTIPTITGSITDLGRAGARGISNIARKSFRTLVDPSCPPGKLPLKERFMIKLKKDYCYGHIKTPLQRAQSRIGTFGCVRYLLEFIYEHPTLYECLTSCTEKGQELRRKRARLRQEIRDKKCTVATDVMLNPPCPSCYLRFPALYPRLLSIVSIYRQCKDMMCFLLAVLVWTPCLLFAEAVRAAICCSLCL